MLIKLVHPDKRRQRLRKFTLQVTKSRNKILITDGWNSGNSRVTVEKSLPGIPYRIQHRTRRRKKSGAGLIITRRLSGKIHRSQGAEMSRERGYFPPSLCILALSISLSLFTNSPESDGRKWMSAQNFRRRGTSASLSARATIFRMSLCFSILLPCARDYCIPFFFSFFC